MPLAMEVIKMERRLDRAMEWLGEEPSEIPTTQHISGVKPSWECASSESVTESSMPYMSLIG